MLRTFSRFFLLLTLCALFVYAPEILSAVSAPYALTPPDRVLLRAALCLDSETSSFIDSAISAHQKDHPNIHLRITNITPQALSHLSPPYPDLIVFTDQIAAQLPANFIQCADHQDILCSIPADCTIPETAAQFAAYIIEASASQSAPSQI